LNTNLISYYRDIYYATITDARATLKTRNTCILG